MDGNSKIRNATALRLCKLRGLTSGALISLTSLFAVAMLGCRGEEAAQQPAVRPLNIAAAANLRFAFDELVADFNREHPEILAKVTYGSSGNFFAQLSNKAPFDVFFSADTSYPHQLVEKGLAVAESAFVYAVGQIVVWVPSGSPIDVEKSGVEALLGPSVRKIAIANPQHAPYGRAAEQALRKLGVYDRVQGKLVLGEDITQTAQFVESGAADVGIIALSLAVAPAMREKGRYWTVPQDAYTPLAQSGVILNWTKNRTDVDAFCRFVTSARGQDIMKRFGFVPPGN